MHSMYDAMQHYSSEWRTASFYGNLFVRILHKYSHILKKVRIQNKKQQSLWWISKIRHRQFSICFSSFGWTKEMNKTYQMALLGIKNPAGPNTIRKKEKWIDIDILFILKHFQEERYLNFKEYMFEFNGNRRYKNYSWKNGKIQNIG